MSNEEEATQAETREELKTEARPVTMIADTSTRNHRDPDYVAAVMTGTDENAKRELRAEFAKDSAPARPAEDVLMGVLAAKTPEERAAIFQESKIAQVNEAAARRAERDAKQLGDFRAFVKRHNLTIVSSSDRAATKALLGDDDK